MEEKDKKGKEIHVNINLEEGTFFFREGKETVRGGHWRGQERTKTNSYV